MRSVLSTLALVAFISATLATPYALVPIAEHVERMLTPPLDGWTALRADSPFDRDCFLTGPSENTPMPCVADHGDETVVLFGDSHAAQWLYALEAIAERRGWRLVSHLKASCPWFGVPAWDRHRLETRGDCDAWREAAHAEIEAERPVAVLLAGTRGGRVGEADFTWRDRVPAWRAAMRRAIERVQSHSPAVILADTPMLETDPFDCIVRNSRIPRCLGQRSIVLDEDYSRLERDLARDTGARIVSVNDILCGPERCPLVRRSAPVYLDATHVSWHYLEAIADAIETLLDEAF